MHRVLADKSVRRLRYLRSPAVVAYWRQRNRFTLEEFLTKRRITASSFTVLVLDAFSEPRSPLEAAGLFPQYTQKSFVAQVRKLVRLRFLIREDRIGDAPDVAAAWKGSFAAAYFQYATRDLTYISDPSATTAYYQGRLAEEKQPAPFRDVRTRTRISLPSRPNLSRVAGLSETLASRRTVREFSRRPVPRETFFGLLTATWGQTGWLDGGLLGPQIAKTSPSAGARHPIECYPIVWNVEGVPPGAYHYSVRRNALELIREGDLRREATRIASLQRWVGQAAFLCVMTTVVERTFWKYPDSDAYRLFFLDAGHVTQTFVLLATAEGLGPFQTAALSESRAERLLGLDGIGEFAFYLCGAGVPSRRRVGGLPIEPALARGLSSR